MILAMFFLNLTWAMRIALPQQKKQKPDPREKWSRNIKKQEVGSAAVKIVAKRNRVFLARPRNISGCVCGDHNRYFEQKRDIFLNLTKRFFVPKPNQSITQCCDKGIKNEELTWAELAHSGRCASSCLIIQACWWLSNNDTHILREKTSQSGVCGTVLTQMGQKIPAVTVLATNSSVNHWVCGLQFTSRPDWLSPLPRRSCDIPPMPAGHSSLHFPPQRPEVPLDHDFNAFFSLLYKCPCLTSSSFSAHMYKSAHLLSCLVGVLFKTRAWGLCSHRTVCWQIRAWDCTVKQWNCERWGKSFARSLMSVHNWYYPRSFGRSSLGLTGCRILLIRAVNALRNDRNHRTYGPWRVFHGAVMVLNGVFCNIKRTKWYQMV